jgi:hypothetical protein
VALHKDYYKLSEVADRCKLTVDDLIYLAVKGDIDVRTYIDFTNITEIKIHPADTVNVPSLGSGLYFINKSDIVKFDFNNCQDSIIINHIYPDFLPCFDEEFPSPHAEDDISIYSRLHDSDSPLLCLEIKDYTIFKKNLVIGTDDLELLIRMDKSIIFDDSEYSAPISTKSDDSYSVANEIVSAETLLAEHGLKFSTGYQGEKTDNLKRGLALVVESYCAKHPGTKRLPLKGILAEMDKLVKAENKAVCEFILEVDPDGKKVAWINQNGMDKDTGVKRVNGRLGYFRRNLNI